MIQHNPVGLIGQVAQNDGNFETGQAIFGQNLAVSHLQQQAQEEAARQALEQAHLDQQNQQFYDAQQQQQDFLRYREQEQAKREQEQFANRQALQQQQYQMQGANQQQLAGMNLAERDAMNQRNNDTRYGIANDRNDLGYYRADQQSQDRAAAQQTRQDIASATDQRIRDLASQRGNNGQDPEFKQWATQTQRMGQYLSGVRAEAERLQSALSSNNALLMPPEQQQALVSRLQAARATLDQLTPQHLQNIQNPPPPRQQPGQFSQPMMGVYAGDETPSVQMGGGYAPQQQPTSRPAYIPQPQAAPPTIDQATFAPQQQQPIAPPPPSLPPPVYQSPATFGRGVVPGQVPAAPPPPQRRTVGDTMRDALRQGWSFDQWWQQYGADMPLEAQGGFRIVWDKNFDGGVTARAAPATQQAQAAPPITFTPQQQAQIAHWKAQGFSTAWIRAQLGL